MSEVAPLNKLLSDEYVQNVRTFGALGYSPERICRILGFSKEKSTVFLLRITTAGDVYYEAYAQGRVLGEYNIDAELAKLAEKGATDSLKLLEERRNERAEKDLRMKLFGI